MPASAVAQIERGARLFACGAGVHADEATGTVAFPQDEIFCPLMADPKQPRSFAGVQWGELFTVSDSASASTTLGTVGLGDRFGLVRWGGGTPGNGIELSVSGAIFAQFDLSAASFDLINADYLVGLPLTWRAAGTTARLRLYHQSSHLGDEYLLREGDIERENLSFESVELIVSQEIGPLRLYAGGERLLRREPASLERMVAHGGIELHSAAGGPLGLVAGIDTKLSEEQDWTPAWSARAGLRITPRARGGHPARQLLILGEYYTGPSPYGQFFQEDVTFAGLGIHLMH